MRTHGSEVFNAWAMAANMQPRKKGQVIFCGLPLFHVNGQLVTGLMPWTQGDRVIIGTPQGYRGEGVIANFWAMVQHFGINFFFRRAHRVLRATAATGGRPQHL